jgi:hypothetical protein
LKITLNKGPRHSSACGRKSYSALWTCPLRECPFLGALATFRRLDRITAFHPTATFGVPANPLTKGSLDSHDPKTWFKRRRKSWTLNLPSES